MKVDQFKGRKIVGGKARGQALVSPEPICFLGGIDVKTGQVTEVGHSLEGKNIAGKVLIFPTGKGSTGGSYLIFESVENGVGPCAIVNRTAEQVTAIGCIIAEIPMMDRVEPDPIVSIHDGDWVEVDADAGILRILNENEVRDLSESALQAAAVRA
jgi:predicted aconitase with swiveling domain